MKKDKVFQLRLTEQELTDLHRVADRAEKPASEVLRLYIARAARAIDRRAKP